MSSERAGLQGRFGDTSASAALSGPGTEACSLGTEGCCPMVWQEMSVCNLMLQ